MCGRYTQTKGPAKKTICLSVYGQSGDLAGIREVVFLPHACF
jgi:hypothetical protein